MKSIGGILKEAVNLRDAFIDDNSLKAVVCADDNERIVFVSVHLLEVLGYKSGEVNSFDDLRSLREHFRSEQDLHHFNSMVSKARHDMTLTAKLDVTNAAGLISRMRVCVAPVVSLTHIITHLLVVLEPLETDSNFDDVAFDDLGAQPLESISKTPAVLQPARPLLLHSKVRGMCSGLMIAKFVQEQRTRSDYKSHHRNLTNVNMNLKKFQDIMDPSPTKDDLRIQCETTILSKFRSNMQTKKPTPRSRLLKPVRSVESEFEMAHV